MPITSSVRQKPERGLLDRHELARNHGFEPRHRHDALSLATSARSTSTALLQAVAGTLLHRRPYPVTRPGRASTTVAGLLVNLVNAILTVSRQDQHLHPHANYRIHGDTQVAVTGSDWRVNGLLERP